MLVTFVVKNLTDDFMIRPTSKEFWALNALLDRLRHRGAMRQEAQAAAL